MWIGSASLIAFLLLPRSERRFDFLAFEVLKPGRFRRTLGPPVLGAAQDRPQAAQVRPLGLWRLFPPPFTGEEKMVVNVRQSAIAVRRYLRPASRPGRADRA